MRWWERSEKKKNIQNKEKKNPGWQGKWIKRWESPTFPYAFTDKCESPLIENLLRYFLSFSECADTFWEWMSSLLIIQSHPLSNTKDLLPETIAVPYQESSVFVPAIDQIQYPADIFTVNNYISSLLYKNWNSQDYFFLNHEV